MVVGVAGGGGRDQLVVNTGHPVTGSTGLILPLATCHTTLLLLLLASASGLSLEYPHDIQNEYSGNF